MNTPKHPSSRQVGFTLVELSIVTVIVGLIFVMFFPASTALIEQQRRKETSIKMAAVDQALLAFVSINRRLPCPADGSVASGTANVGTESRDANGDCLAQNAGVVPWATIGLAEADTTDGWGARLTYRVPDGVLGFTKNNALNATLCDPAGTAARTTGVGATPASCAPTCNRTNLATCISGANLLANRGLLVVDEAGNAMMSPPTGTGAAYVVISPMAEGGGGYSSSGTLLAGSIAAGADGELRNTNGQAIPVAGFFHDSRVIAGGNAGSAHFDDQLSHPSVMQILAKAQLAPRAQ